MSSAPLLGAVSQGPTDTWGSFYVIFGIICVILAVVYAVYITFDFRVNTPKMPGFKGAHLMYIISSFSRGIGAFTWGIFILVDKSFFVNNARQVTGWDAGLNGIPGYVITIAYCCVFFLWCSICANLLINESSDFYYQLRNTFIFCLAFISCLGIIFLALMVTTEKTEVFHQIEIWIAIARDVVACGFIFYYIIRIIKELREKLFNWKSDEFVMCVMSVSIGVCILVRPISTFIYFYSFASNGDEMARWSTGNLVNTVIGQIICELIPIIIVFIGRKKSGLLSVYDPLVDE